MFEGINAIVARGVAHALVLTPERRARVLDRVQRYVAEHAIPLPADADPAAVERRRVQVERFSARITHLCAENVLTLGVEDGRVRVDAASGEAETTLAYLRRGTSWFQGVDDVERLLAGAIF